MSHRYHHICQQNMGRVAQFRMHDGHCYTGRISRVTSSGVHLTPVHGTGISERIEMNKIGVSSHSILGSRALDHKKNKNGESVFFFFPFFIPFLAIAGLTFVGAAAATAPFYARRRVARRPIRRGFY